MASPENPTPDSPASSPLKGCLMLIVMFVGSIGGAYVLVRILHFATGT